MRSCSATRDPRRDNGSRSVRGRQSASPRITGGLVSHDQAKRSGASPVGLRDMPAGSKRAAIRVAWSTRWDLPALASHVGKLTWRRPTAVGDERGGASLRVPNAERPAALPLDLVNPCYQDSCIQTPSPAAWCPEAAMHGEQVPFGHRRSVRSGIGGGLWRRPERPHDRAAGSLAWSGRPQGTLG
jgi:hypothetical protein